VTSLCAGRPMNRWLDFRQTGAPECQSAVQQLVTGWKVRGSNPGGEPDFPHPYTPVLGPTQPTV